MNKTTTIVFLTAGLALAGHATATAQTTSSTETRALVSVNILAQPSTRNIDLTKTFDLYGEQGTVSTTQHISNGAVVDIAGYYVIRPQLSAGIDFSTFGNSSGSGGFATIPDPLVFNRPRTVGLSAAGLTHRENAVHLQVRYAWPYRDKMEVALVAGPSIFHVKQQLVSSVSVPAGTQNATPNVSDESKTAFGGNIGVEGNYFFNPRYGAGILIRYAGASADLPSFSGLHLGGFQVGVGFRARF